MNTKWADIVGKAAARLRYASGSSSHAEGRVVAYSDAPMICIQTYDDRRIWWRADLSEVLNDDFDERVREWEAANDTTIHDHEDKRRKAALFNDLSHAPTDRFVDFGQRHQLAEYLWEMGWRRDLIATDETTPSRRKDIA